MIGIDIGKNSFHVVGHDKRGAIVLRQKWSRGQVEARLANLPPCLIGMEACVGAHHLSSKLQMLGHDHWFRRECDKAGLPHCSAHGLRKAAARRLAEAGCTAHEIGAITGHASLKEVERYTKAADQQRLAQAAMARAMTAQKGAA